MKFFTKLNAVAALYAFVLCMATELMLNVYRISRKMDWEVTLVTNSLWFVYLIGFILCTILLILLTIKWLKARIALLWCVVLWFPYYVLFIFIFTYILPVTNPGDDPGPGAGIILLGMLVAYPFYILCITLIGISIGNREQKICQIEES
ncbi:hypothetical protein [Radiobacillus sp. PE A8.2]|uniref:hypothetical protein n=1 Tax=Radiobacillus sp. PE A8.2 TaxID=3380349 RepID=UPI00388D9A5A